MASVRPGPRTVDGPEGSRGAGEVDDHPSLDEAVRGLERRLLAVLAVAVVGVVVGYLWLRPDLSTAADRRTVLLGLISLLSLLALTGLGLLTVTVSRIHEGFERRDAARERLVAEADAHAERLETKSQQLERRNEDLRRFAYVVAHDLREPARTVSTHARMAQRAANGELDPEVRQRLDEAVDAAQHLHDLLGDLLAYVTVDQHCEDLEWVDLEDAVDEALVRLDRSELEPEAEVVVGSLPSVEGYRIPLVRLFQELIGNALKFASPDGAPHVEIRGEAIEDAWVLEVEDDGVGIEPEYAGRVFSMFERLEPDVPGTGAGLSICRRIVELHGGEIELDPEASEGLTVRIWLPREPAEIPDAEDERLDPEIAAVEL